MMSFEHVALPQMLVLGRGMADRSIPTRATEENAIAAAAYYHEVNGEVDRIVFSGGTSHMASERVAEGISEAEAMRRIAVDAGVPDSRIVRECTSANTIENFLNSTTFLDQIGSTGIVTHSAQMPRALYVARKVLKGSVYPIITEEYEGTPEEGGIKNSIRTVWIPAAKDRLVLRPVDRGDVARIQRRNKFFLSLYGGNKGPAKKFMGSSSQYN